MRAIISGSSSTKTFSFQLFPGTGLDFRNICSFLGICCCESQPLSFTIAGLEVTNLVTRGQAGKTSEIFSFRQSLFRESQSGTSIVFLIICMHKLANRMLVIESLGGFKIQNQKWQIIEKIEFKLSNQFLSLHCTKSQTDEPSVGKTSL